MSTLASGDSHEQHEGSRGSIRQYQHTGSVVAAMVVVVVERERCTVLLAQGFGP